MRVHHGRTEVRIPFSACCCCCCCCCADDKDDDGGGVLLTETWWWCGNLYIIAGTVLLPLPDGDVVCMFWSLSQRGRKSRRVLPPCLLPPRGVCTPKRHTDWLSVQRFVRGWTALFSGGTWLRREEDVRGVIGCVRYYIGIIIRSIQTSRARRDRSDFRHRTERSASCGCDVRWSHQRHLKYIICIITYRTVLRVYALIWAYRFCQLPQHLLFL